MVEGLIQGCPLSVFFASLILDSIIRPLDKELRDRAALRAAEASSVGLPPGDGGHSSVTNFQAYVDDLSTVTPLVDLRFLIERFLEIAPGKGGDGNWFKTRVLTSCNGESILADLQHRDPDLAADVEWVLDNYSVRPDPEDVAKEKTLRVEVTDGFRLLGQPVGSPAFADTFFADKVAGRGRLSGNRGSCGQNPRPAHTDENLRSVLGQQAYPPSGRRHHAQPYGA